MKNRLSSLGPTLWISIAFILIGTFLLLENLDIYYFSDFWDYWPLIFVFVGVIKLISSDFRDIYSSTVFIAIGFILLSMTMGWIYFSDIWQLWPLIFILVGVRIIYTKLKSDQRTGEEKGDSYSDDTIDDVAVFGGKEKRISSQNFRGGNIVVLFGGMELFFDNARLAEGETILNMVVMFGGAEIHVPRDWKVITKGFPMFGGFEDKRTPLSQEESLSKQELVIKGVVMFGGLEIKNI
jgi:predicted membrane protein